MLNNVKPNMVDDKVLGDAKLSANDIANDHPITLKRAEWARYALPTLQKRQTLVLARLVAAFRPARRASA